MSIISLVLIFNYPPVVESNETLLTWLDVNSVLLNNFGKYEIVISCKYHTPMQDIHNLTFAFGT